MAGHAQLTGLDYRIMAVFGCTDADRLLNAYLHAIQDANKANSAYVQGLSQGSVAVASAKAKAVKEMIDRVREARKALQQHRRRHRC